MFSAVARLGPVGAAFLVKAYASPCKGESGIGKSEVGDAPTSPPPVANLFRVCRISWLCDAHRRCVALWSRGEVPKVTGAMGAG